MRIFLISIFLTPFPAFCQLELAHIFSDNMVLQRDKPVHIWGKFVPGKQVTVYFSGQKTSTQVNADSSWSVYLRKQKANATPQLLRVLGGNDSIVLKNILLGDVWLCSGQSNMEWPLHREMHWQEEEKNTDQPLIRLYNPTPAGRNVYAEAYSDSISSRLNTDAFYGAASWSVCDSHSVRLMSAVGYFFAKRIVAGVNVPVGVINLSIGGAPIETFIGTDALQSHPRFSKKLVGDWLQNEEIPVWPRERGRQNVGDNKSGFGDGRGLNHAYKPGFAYASGIQPILPMAIKGVLWYQGESNAQELPRVEEYRDLLHLMIVDYRRRWKQPQMPFYWVQLSSIDTARYKSKYWPLFRDEQRRLLVQVKKGGMAVCSDIGSKNDVHPTNKKDVGERLAKWALNKTYGKDIVPSGPLPVKARYRRGRVVISFQYTANGLQTNDGEPLRGFSTDGHTDMVAAIEGKRVIIPLQGKSDFIYYGWKPFTDANLINSENLPASTFKIKVR